MEKKDELTIQEALVKRTDSEESGLVQVTTYIYEDQALALEMIRTAVQQKRGGYCDPAELFQEAIDLLIKKHLIAIKLRD